MERIRCDFGTTGPSAIREKPFSYGGSVSQTIESPPEGANVMVAKIEMNIGAGDNDRISIWTNAGDVTSEIALGAADFVAADSDVFGSTFDYLGIFARSSRIDSVRVSNDPLAFRFVTTGIIPAVPTELLTILSIARSETGNSTEFTWRSEIGRMYAVETSADLIHWEELSDDWLATDVTTSFEHFDSEAGAPRRRYYRVRLLL